jgi:hypothetical protein
MIKSFFKWWSTRDERAIENYLASSTDLVELERRQQMMARKGIY